VRVAYKASEGDTFHPYSQNEISVQLPFYISATDNKIVSEEERNQMVAKATEHAILGGRRFQMPQFEQMKPFKIRLSTLARYHEQDTHIYNPVGTFMYLIDVKRDARVEEMPADRARRKMREIKVIDGRIARQWEAYGRDTTNDEVTFLHELKLPLLRDLVQARVDAKENNDYVFITREKDKPKQWIRITVPFNTTHQLYTQINLGDPTLQRMIQVDPEVRAVYTQMIELLGDNEFDGFHEPPVRHEDKA
jgi:hypothetical protein